MTDVRPIAMVITRDRKISETFYGDTSGLRRRPDDAFAAVFDLDGVAMRPTEVPGHVASPHPIPGWHVKDIGTIVAALAEKGVHMKFYDGMGQDAQGIWTGPDGTKVAFFNDPDGNALSLAQPA